MLGNETVKWHSNQAVEVSYKSRSTKIMGKKGFDSKLIDDKGELCKMTDTHIIKSCCKKLMIVERTFFLLFCWNCKRSGLYIYDR